jgi:hypothetical protein
MNDANLQGEAQDEFSNPSLQHYLRNTCDLDEIICFIDDDL